MTSIKSLLAAALLSTVAAASFAQTPTAPKGTSSISTPHTTATTNSTAKATHHKKHHKAHHAKKTTATAPASTAKKAG